MNIPVVKNVMTHFFSSCSQMEEGASQTKSAERIRLARLQTAGELPDTGSDGVT